MSEWDVLSFSLRLNWQDGVAHTAKSMLSQLARDRRILNFNPPREWRAVLRHPFAHPPRLYRVQDNLWHFEWGYLYPKFYRQLVAVRVTGFAARMCVQYLCRKLGLSSPIYLFWGPFQADLLPHLPRRFTVYYAYDMFEAFVSRSEEERAYDSSRERLAASYADVAFGVSDGIVEHLQKKGFSAVYYLPNGVNFEMFAQAEHLPEPVDLHSIPRPRLAYVGDFREAINLDLLQHVARSRPTWSVVLIGSPKFATEGQQEKYERLRQMPNVFVTGTRPHHSVPAYVAHIDVGLALYRMESSARYNSPLKVYEYLAAGKPSVVTPNAETIKMGHLVYFASTPDECVERIDQAIREDWPERQQQRRELARQHSWENRAKQMTEIIEQCLQR